MRFITSILFNVGLWETIKNIFLWAFDNSCDPDKFNILINLFR